ncbi:MAG: hypothetical protein M1165_02395, partial [Candidatus Pacearchaeota archaeon]|nr:hypothetical protein [Candidatus Pacearchaeota archaeon]
MKKSILTLAIALLFFSIGYVSATCVLTPTLLSQDPYPAVPGDYVKLVFQVTGMANSDCGQVIFQLVPEYPISFDPGVSSYYSALGGSYATNYNNYLTIPFTVRVDPDAVKGNNTIYLTYVTQSISSNSSISTPFNLSIQDVKSDFYVFVKNYDFTTRDLTLEVLNIGQNDVD